MSSIVHCVFCVPSTASGMLMRVARNVFLFTALLFACGSCIEVDAQHRVMSAFAPPLDMARVERGFFASSSWLVQASGAVGAVTPPKGTFDEAELSEYPARDNAWVLTTSEQVALYGSADNVSLDLRCSQQLYASRRNDIGFNPRSAVWDEELSLRNFLPSSPAFLSAHVFHRCKHDIDNSDSEENDSVASRLQQKRTIILGGIAASLSSHPLRLATSSQPIDVVIECRGEYYWYAGDYRYPAVRYGASWADMVGSAELGICASTELFSGSRAGIRALGTMAFFAASIGRSASYGQRYLLDGFITFQGRAGDATVSLQYRDMFDHGLRITADRASFLALCLTLQGR